MDQQSATRIYIVSDSAEETGESAARLAAMQFYPEQIEIVTTPFIQECEDVEKTVNSARVHGGMIVFTLVVPRFRDALIHKAQEYGVPYIDLLGPIVSMLAQTLRREPSGQPGIIHQLDDDYFKKVEAVEFAVKYDDGRDFSGICKADIVLLGVSRTSKTPLSMYLAHKRFKVANVPIVPEMKPPQEIYSVAKDKIIGLRIDPNKLNVIRQERLRTLGLADNATYANVERIKLELAYADEIMNKIGCVVFDVSNRAVEETANLIMDHIGQIR